MAVASTSIGWSPAGTCKWVRPNNTGPAAGFHSATDGVGTWQSGLSAGELGSDSSEKCTVRPVRTRRSGKKSDGFGLHSAYSARRCGVLAGVFGVLGVLGVLEAAWGVATCEIAVLAACAKQRKDSAIATRVVAVVAVANG